MMTPNELLTDLATSVTATDTGDGIRLSTHCLYPSNGAVSVLVRGGADSFVVSDDGGAIQEISGSGRLPVDVDRFLKRLVKPQGLKAENGVIFSPIVTARDISAAILLVANASKEVADWGLANIKLKAHRNFRNDLADLLGRHFNDNLKHDLPILGASNKSHKFRHVIHLARNRMLLIDPATNEAASINACVVANMDVRMVNNPNVLQLIVYDDRETWESAQLKVLGLGAPTVPFGMAEREIMKIAA